MSSPHRESFMLPDSSEIIASATVLVPPDFRLTVRGSPMLSILPVTLTLRIPAFSSLIFMFFAKAPSRNKCYMLVTVIVCPQSVQTSFMPAAVFSRTSWIVFEWHFVHSLDTVSGLGMLPHLYRQSKI